jgi:hypothetical protein
MINHRPGKVKRHVQPAYLGDATAIAADWSGDSYYVVKPSRLVR